LDQDKVKQTTIVFKGDTFNFPGSAEYATSKAGTIKLDENKTPKEMDAISTEKETMLGIYALEENGYKVCFAPAGKPRPTEFTSAPAVATFSILAGRSSNADRTATYRGAIYFQAIEPTASCRTIQLSMSSTPPRYARSFAAAHLGLVSSTMPSRESAVDAAKLNFRIEAVATEVEAESERAAVTLAVAEIDQALRDLLESFVLPPSAASKKYGLTLFGQDEPAGTLSARIELAYRLGLIPAWCQRDAHVLRRVRNEFAHKTLGYTFASSPPR
jgi:uncharacterized protein (TIGR03067 family)